MNFSIKQLKAFAALAAERNFTRAAEKCHLTQSAFSTLIQNLEQQAGAALFQRSTRSVELTAEGALFDAAVTRLLPEFEQAFGELADHVQRRKGRVTVAALPSIAASTLAPVVARFRGDYPGIEIVLRDVTADTCLELVRNRQADLALSAAMSPGADLSSETLMTDTFYLVCRDDHPLAGRAGLDIGDIAGMPLLRFDRTSSIRQHIDAAFFPHQPPAEMEVSNLVTAAGLVAAGVGATLVPGLALFPFQQPRLRAIPIRLGVAEREVCLIRRRGVTDSVAAAAFVEVLKDYLGNAAA